MEKKQITQATRIYYTGEIPAHGEHAYCVLVGKGYQLVYDMENAGHRHGNPYAFNSATDSVENTANEIRVGA